LAEVKSIATEAGLGPILVECAALHLPVMKRDSAVAKVVGGPIRSEFTDVVDGRMSKNGDEQGLPGRLPTDPKEGRLVAGGADTVEHEVVGLHLESVGCQRIDPFGATVDVEGSATDPAYEVVMMGMAGKLVTDGIPRNLNGGQPPLLHQQLHIPIHCGDSQGGGESLPSLHDLLRYQRTT
jgi:hypothetical protein